MKRLVLALLLIAAVQVTAQKPNQTSLGFNPEKIYDFSSVDSVNSFNGNVILPIPLGLRYQVGPVISYQFMLTYNSMIWDYLEWDDSVGGVTLVKFHALPNLRSNAGVGWRLSLGRLFGPTDTSQVTLGQKFIYEGPAGDEHPFDTIDPNSHSNNPLMALTNETVPLRMMKTGTEERRIEFPSGEVRVFRIENSAWRLKEIDDPFGNWVTIDYVYDPLEPRREMQWTVKDSLVVDIVNNPPLHRQHIVTFAYKSALVDSTNYGGTVTSLQTVGVGNARLNYDFGYTDTPVARACGDDGSFSGGQQSYHTLPLLTSVMLQANGTQYSFEYNANGTTIAYGCDTGTLRKVTYPTAGTTTYKYGIYEYGGDVCTIPDYSQLSDPRPSPGITSRTVDDGVSGPHEWKYVQMRGPAAPITYNTPSDPCYPAPQRPPVGPPYWTRTSVVSPALADGTHVRTDRFFDIFGGFEGHGTPTDSFTKNPVCSTWCYSNVYGVPPANHKALDTAYPADISAADESGVRVLTTRVYTGCDGNGDCTNGTLARSVYEEPRWGAFAKKDSTYKPPSLRAPVPRSSRTVYESDTGCGPQGGPYVACYVDVVGSDADNAGHYQTSTTTSNFGSNAITTSTKYPKWSTQDKSWTDVDLLSVATAMPSINTFTERSTTDGIGAEIQKFCFDLSTGFLLRQRTLAGATDGTSDVIKVFTRSGQGDLEKAYTYGGDGQSVSTGSICSVALPATPVYLTESSYLTADNKYTGGLLTWSRFYDPSTSTPLTFRIADRTIDVSSGLVTSSADTAGARTSVVYEIWGHVKSVTSPAGAVTTYTYSNASGAAGSSFSPMKIDAVTSSSVNTLRSQFVLDGLGRLIRQSHLNPDGNWSATQTAYDAEGRKISVSAPESTGASAPSGALTAALKTTTTYDAFGRPLTVTAADGSATAYTYTGVRATQKTLSVFTGSANTATNTTYTYDGFGRLTGVKESSGPTTSTTTLGSDVITTYGYDGGGHLS